MVALNFEFWIGCGMFKKLSVLVNGIYPEMAGFVKTIHVPTSHAQKRFGVWQETSQKC